MTTPVEENNVYELIELVKDGSQAAGTYLVSLCGERLSRYIGMIARDMSDADREMVCEKAIERAVRKIESYDPSRASFDSWLRGFVRYIVMEERRKPLVTPLDPFDISERADAKPMQSSQSLIEKEVSTSLAELSETDQLIIRLRDYEELPYLEIAALLNVAEPATRQRHVRALQRLRTLLEPRLQGLEIGPLSVSKIEDDDSDR